MLSRLTRKTPSTTSAEPSSSDAPRRSPSSTAPMSSETSGTKKMYAAARLASPAATSPNHSAHASAVPISEA